MRRLGKVVVWLAVFASAAGVGAYIAAHSEPFPPSVDPGNSFNPTTPPAAPQPKWRVVMTSATKHRYYTALFTTIPQFCVSRFRSTFTFTIDTDTGKVRGTGIARRLGKLRCTFIQAQAEIEQLELKVVGTYRGGKAHVHLVNAGASPVGADDYGGFTRTILTGGGRSAFDLRVAATSAAQKGSFSKSEPDGDRGTYLSDSRFQVTCIRGCEG